MEDEIPSKEAISLFLQEESNLDKAHRLSVWSLVFGLFLIGLFVYAQLRASEIVELSNQMNIQAESEEVRALFDLVDRKISLLKAELKFRNTWVGIVGGLIIGGSIVEMTSYRSRKRKIRVMKQIVNRLDADT